ncbi:MAG: nucleoside deaminase [Desulfobulbus sp.]|jgi:tRNA(adenine34) deaminase
MDTHEHFMDEALGEARLALQDGEFPVGCVMVADGAVMARGRRQHTRAGQCNEIDHAEVLTLRSLLAEHPEFDMGRLTVYSTMEPCLMCYATLLLSGIRSFVWAYEDVMGGGTSLPLEQLNPLYAAMRVRLLGRVRRSQSLLLFQQFFRTGTYWSDSLLARYTLSQPVESSAP